MNKNTLIGFVLIAVVLVGFSWYSQPSQEEMRAQFVKDSLEQVAKQKADQAAKIAAYKQQQAAKEQVAADTTALFYKALTGKAQDVVLQNAKLAVTLSTKGGTVTKAYIKNEKGSRRYVGHNIADKTGKSDDLGGVTLFSGKDQSLNYTLVAKEMNISTGDLFFEPTAVTDSTVTLTAEAGQGKSLIINYRLGSDYMLHVSLRTVGMAGLFDPNTTTLGVDWHEKVKEQERGFTFENRYARLDWKESEGGTDYISEAKTKKETTEEEIDWIAFKNQFFSAVMISKDNFQKGGQLESTLYDKKDQENQPVRYLKDLKAQVRTSFDPTGAKPSEFEFYYGPNDFYILKQVEKQSTFGKELDMQRIVYLGWPLFRYINRWFTLPVFTWLSDWGLPMGIVLILITILLKVITFPMVKKSYMSSAKMRVLKPKLDEATKQFNKPEDQMQKQQAMMAEYAKYGVSPLSGCLPMLIQMPIWVAMFNFVPNAIQFRGENFLWMSDLSTYDPIVEWSTNVMLIGDHLSLTCVLYTVAMVLYTWITMQMQKDQMVGQQAEQMKVMQWMMFLMPLMFFFIFNDYSSGLNFYYFVTLILSAGIMMVLRRTTNDAKLLAILEARYKENAKNPQKMKGLAARMQALQQMQQQQMQQQQGRDNNRKR
ncbi:MAG: membrane protein insertase YidC [Hallella sp.]|uniref:membrane protein insertase YidC n=1 Tax=Hallella sp. TaxID=2980186 RepID=UPI00283CA6FE|nr:membrane protein insertase YidC [Hallella sp.]MDR4000568.1 membrane protein insertase YidC [Hallella sp.]MDY5926151.1 membrane protein insertase YidC [Hallella sp.]MED9944861.1 membrane protein insertase YidC [Hallella sp.]